MSKAEPIELSIESCQKVINCLPFAVENPDAHADIKRFLESWIHQARDYESVSEERTRLKAQNEALAETINLQAMDIRALKAGVTPLPSQAKEVVDHIIMSLTGAATPEDLEAAKKAARDRALRVRAEMTAKYGSLGNGSGQRKENPPEADVDDLFADIHKSVKKDTVLERVQKTVSRWLR